MLTWLLHHFRCGAIVSNRAFAYSTIASQIVIPEDDHLARKRGYSAATAAIGRLRTLRWYITATAQNSQSCGHPRVAKSLPPVRSRRWYKVLARHRRGVQSGRGGRAIARRITAEFEFPQELRPVDFGFADENHVGVGLGFIRHQRDVRPAQRHPDSSFPELRGKIVGVGRARRMKSDAHQIRRHRHVNRRTSSSI